jgi:hypothetical protein
MSGTLISDRKVGQAVSAVVLRSDEREADFLSATFVDPGITDRLANQNSQILWGRRGTGKTHVFRVLEREMAKRSDQLAVYVDLAKLGSAGIYRDDRPADLRAVHLFKDLMAVVANTFLDYATAPETKAVGPLLESQVALIRAITRSTLSNETYSHEVGAADTSIQSGELRLSASSPAASLGASRSSERSKNQKTATAGSPQAYLSFQELSDALGRVVHDGGLNHVYIFLDEWAAIPYELQPYIAEFVKRSLLAEPRITVKIAAIEYRSNFGVRLPHNNILGFELGADIASGLELDDYFVYDRNADKTLTMFARLLYRHLAAEVEAGEVALEIQTRSGEDTGDHLVLEWMVREVIRRVKSHDRYLTAEYGISDPDGFVHALFHRQEVFRELVRAGEGVARDFINIFASAYFAAQRRDLAKIDMEGVRAAARDWYERDKAENVTEEQNEVLRRIVKKVIGQNKVRSFLLEKNHERDDMIRSLFDFRLLHLIHRGYMDVEDIGRRYNIYAIDYGAYVDLLGSAHAPARDLTTDIQEENTVIPFGDKRRMKRVILDPSMLKVANALHGHLPS